MISTQTLHRIIERNLTGPEAAGELAIREIRGGWRIRAVGRIGTDAGRPRIGGSDLLVSHSGVVARCSFASSEEEAVALFASDTEDGE
jgi:hypothetical protein